jgi:pimeloyl-ACP methyl ester carboxylesterase
MQAGHKNTYDCINAFSEVTVRRTPPWVHRMLTDRHILAPGYASRSQNTYDCIKAFSETDFTEDLKKFDIPTLIVHGDDDQIVPISAAALRSAKLVKNAMLKIYAGAPHGLGYTHKDQLNADLLAFLKT